MSNVYNMNKMYDDVMPSSVDQETREKIDKVRALGKQLGKNIEIPIGAKVVYVLKQGTPSVRVLEYGTPDHNRFVKMTGDIVQYDDFLERYLSIPAQDEDLES